MSNIILEYPILNEDADLAYTHYVAYQKDRTTPFDYDQEYFDNYVDRAGTEVAIALNDCRVNMAENKCKCKCLVDVGIGSGEFINRSNVTVYGYDINPVGVQWLQDRSLYVDIYQSIPSDVDGFTLWDTLEHIPEPNLFLDVVDTKQVVIVSLPTFEDLSKVKLSKHYKPNEHLWYFTVDGMKRYMDDSGFAYLGHNHMETHVGREGITTFAFIKRL